MGTIPVANPSTPQRLRFPRRGIAIALLIAALLVSALLVGFFFVIPSGEPSPIVRAGPIERYAPGTVTYFEDRHVLLVRRTDGSFLALSDSAQHLEGETVEWLPDFEFLGIRGWFRSPAHSETFAMDGTLAFGPAARDMDRFQVFVCEGRVTIDTTEAIDPDDLASISCGIE